MAPSRGRGGFRGRGGSRGGRGGRGGARGGGSGKLARSGIRTKNGYKKFDSQRLREVDESEDEQPQIEEAPESEDRGIDDAEETEEVKPTVTAYNTLLQSFKQAQGIGERKAKRRKIEEVPEPVTVNEDQEVEVALIEDGEAEDGSDGEQNDDIEGDLEDETDPRDPFEMHFANPDDNELQQRLKAIQSNDMKTEKGKVGRTVNLVASAPSCVKQNLLRQKGIKTMSDLPLKERLARNVQKQTSSFLPSELEQTVASYLLNYEDILLGNPTPRNAAALRSLASLHAVNHILKGRDKVIKNNEKLNHTEDTADLDVRDQGFVRPKVLILLETRQMAARYADTIVSAFQPDQQENRKRFDDSFSLPIDDREALPEDYRELFGGNNDNSFLTALKFTRKTLKFYSAFYNSDIIIASPLGLRRIIENEDAKKRDYDFLSSIEIVIADQVDAMQMQNWENVELVFKHLNLELKETHGCDFSRVRNWYLDGNAKYLRQTVIFAAYITPEMNRLYNIHMLNVSGKIKLTPTYPGAITQTSGLNIKQTFHRFDSPSPANDPDARFKFFTSAILPALLRQPNASGILIFVSSYFDFLRLRNYFATSTQTENISFGTIHDYSEVSDQRRARSHFLNGRHSILLYTQRAHHFFRLRIKGVKRVVMYGLPDNEIFYEEMVGGFLGANGEEVVGGVKSCFSKWDGLRLERIVGSERVRNMLGGVGDTFDFV